MPYRVTLEDAKEALGITDDGNEMNNMHYIKQKGSNGWGISENLPHIDPSTGNIHIAFDPMKWDGKIHQLILRKRTGVTSPVLFCYRSKTSRSSGIKRLPWK